MEIDRNRFTEWLEQHFNHVQIRGDEAHVPDIWWHDVDTKLKCWINLHKCCYHAFKSKKKGHICDLIMELEGCSWDEAIEIAGGEDSIVSLEKRLEQFLAAKEEPKSLEIGNIGSLPPDTYLISSLHPKHPDRQVAERYLETRKIPIGQLMICLSGEYKHRLVIPYYNRIGRLVYFNTRNLYSSAYTLRYKGPPTSHFGWGKSQVLWCQSWPRRYSRIYLTEGEFDAMSLNQAGFPAMACGGKELSQKQMNLIRVYSITLAFDADEAGKHALDIAEELMASGFKELGWIRPPKPVKDWNGMLVKYGKELIREYVKKNERMIDQDSINQLRMSW